MSLNIKDGETHRLVRELAAATGDSMSAALKKAVIEKLDRVRGARGADLAERLLAIGRDCAPRLKEPFRSADHADLLYGNDGLPK